MHISWIKSYSRQLSFWLLGLSLIFIFSLKAQGIEVVPAYTGQGQQTLKLAVKDPRPLKAAIKLLQDRHGLMVTYEDPRFSHETDLVDETDPKYRQAHPGGPRALTPKGGRLEITYPVSAATGKPENTKLLLQALLNAHADADNPGRFRLKQSGQYFHIIPAQVKNDRGQWVDQNSILDIPITFARQERTVFETMEVIGRTLSQATQIKFVINPGPINLFYKNYTLQGASGESARDVLTRTLESTNKRFSWLLLYDAGMRWFVLNLCSIPN